MGMGRDARERVWMRWPPDKACAALVFRNAAAPDVSDLDLRFGTMSAPQREVEFALT